MYLQADSILLLVLRVTPPVSPQRCCPIQGTLRAISERVETRPLLRLCLAVLTIGSLLTIAIINLVSSRVGTFLPWCTFCL